VIRQDSPSARSLSTRLILSMFKRKFGLLEDMMGRDEAERVWIAGHMERVIGILLVF
jgi:hypothetical protein